MKTFVANCNPPTVSNAPTFFSLLSHKDALPKSLDVLVLFLFFFLQGGRYSTPDGRITIFACDLFDVTPEMVGKVDAIWDRGSFVALSFETRPRYAALLRRLVGDSFR